MFYALWNLRKGLKSLLIGLLLLTCAYLLWILTIPDENQNALSGLKNIPNYNYIPLIKNLRDEGKLQEALELTRFILKNPDMPGQGEAKELEKELENEINSWIEKAKRATKGFVLGSGNSIEENVGGITSDLIVWGDIRDLIKQGYFKITGHEKTDPVVVALAGIGLATEFVDFADWVPAVLKAFRKVGALLGKFSDFIISTAKKSAKAMKLDSGLKTTFKYMQSLVDKMGFSRTATVMKHVDTAEELADIAQVAEKNADTAYLIVKNGQKEGVDLIRQLGKTDEGLHFLSEAAKKGSAGIQWLKQNRKVLLSVRFGARLVKNLRLERVKKLVQYAMNKLLFIKLLIWITFIVLLISSFLLMTKSIFYFRSLMPVKKTKKLKSTLSS